MFRRLTSKNDDSTGDPGKVRLRRILRLMSQRLHVVLKTQLHRQAQTTCGSTFTTETNGAAWCAYLGATYLEEWIHVGDDSSKNLGEQSMVNIPTMVHDAEYKDCTTIQKRPEEAPSASRSSWQASGENGTPIWKISRTQGTASFWEKTEAPLPHPKRRCNFIHPKQLSPFPERLELPFPSEFILSGCEEVVSSSQDRYTTWVNTDPDVTLERHIVDIQKAVADDREAAARRQESTTQEHFCDANMPKRSYVQKRLSIYNWNPGPRRGKEGAIEKQIAGKWHVVTLQEAIDFVDHEFLTNRFHVTHYGGCAVLFNKDTFFLDVKVKSIYLHDTRRELPGKIMKGDSGWVVQCVLSRASFRRRRSCLHIFTTSTLRNVASERNSSLQPVQ